MTVKCRRGTTNAHRSAGAGLLLALTLLCATAAGQSEPQPAEATSEAATGAEVAPTPTAAAEDPAFAVAKDYFERGKKLFDANNFDAALVEFEMAYEHMSGHPKQYFVLDNIGMCHERLFRYDLAMQYYRRFLKEGGAHAEDAAVVEATIKSLEGLLATLTLESNVPAEVWVDDRLMGKAPGDVLIPGGRHVVELRAQGHQAAKREVSVAARESGRFQFTLDPIPEHKGLRPLYFWSGTALTVVSAGVGTYFGAKAMQAHQDAEDRRAVSPLLNTAADEKDIRKKALIADVCFGSATLFAVGTTLLYFMTDWEKQEAPSKTNTLELQASASLGHFNIELGGSF